MLGGVVSFVLDVRSERALRAAVAAAITSVGALYSSPKQGYWGLAMRLVQMVVSYFPTVSLGQALCPATALGWGFFIGCGIVSVLYFAATGGALALWFSTVLFILLLEPIISNEDAYVAGVTMSFLFVVVDGVLLNAADMLTKSSFESNVEQLIAAWGYDGAIWSMYVSALMCMGLVLFIHLLPPWRSTSRLSARLVAQQLTEAKQIMEDVASLLDSSAREAVACAPPLESHVTIVPGLPSVKIQGLSERCTKQLVALRSLPGFLRMVDYEPVVWPPSARQVGLADWKELLGRIRMMLHRMQWKRGGPITY